MRSNGFRKSITYSLCSTALLFALTSVEAYSGCCDQPVKLSVPGRIYLGIYGGWGQSTRIDISQYGTAFFREQDQGGPLAVDAFGRTDRRSVKLYGAQIGYQGAQIDPGPCSRWGFAPAVEWEGYYLSESTFTAHDINNRTDRLDEHDFEVTYPIKTGVYLTNAVLNINSCDLNKFRPYIGVGFGAAVLTISDANSLQVAPPEPGVNHYNSNPNDRESTFAAQAKLGLNYDFNKTVSIFAEYRWLYLCSSDYTFGSTVYPGHAATSSWHVRLDPQHYSLGAIGIRFYI